MKRSSTHAAVLAITLGFAITSVAPALAANDEVIKRGGCSGSSDWKLKAKPDDGRLEVEGEVDSNRNDQTWHWKILHNGTVAKQGTATTTAPSGSFEVERRIGNAPGSDRVGWRAANGATGEVCRGSLSI
jgi:hypothetical protein